MHLNSRVARLENRHPLVEEDGFRPCAQCNNGERWQIVIRFEGRESSDPLPTCPKCGRDIACIINFCSAEPVATHDPRREPPNDRPSLLPRASERGGDDAGDARADL